MSILPTPELPAPVEIPDSSDSEISNVEDVNSENKDSLTINFPIRGTYSSSWGCREAFRELVQNWRDGIIQAFAIRENQFLVVRTDRSTNRRQTEILFHVPDPTNQKNPPLGYIRFSGRDGLGQVEIVNRKAVLEPRHLDLGETNKADANDQAGAHGEGMKIALLVMQRVPHNHRIRCVTGDWRWNFNFTIRGKLVARLRQMTPKQLAAARDEANRTTEKGLTPFSVSATEDVKFVIGEKGQGRDAHGQKRSRTQVSIEEFNELCKAALFLTDGRRDTAGVIKTSCGDLLVDESLRGKLYLKGLLLKESTAKASASMTGVPLRYGYNFQNGVTNREREAVRQPSEESEAIFAIWDKALESKPALVSELSDMLLASKVSFKYADVMDAHKHIKPSTALRLKNHIFTDNSIWYYATDHVVKNSRLPQIISGLRRKGMEIPDNYWRTLRKHNLVRTAEEEQTRRFLDAEDFHIMPGTFAESIHRLLQACFRGCPQTSEVSASFVKANNLELHSFYVHDQKMFKIHERWLLKESVLNDFGLPSRLMESDILLHAVKYLFKDALKEMPRGAFQHPDGRSIEWHRDRAIHLAHQRLMEFNDIQKSLRVDAAGPKSALKVEWNRFSSWPADSPVVVHLHCGSFCANLRRKVLVEDFDEDSLLCLESTEDGLGEDGTSTPQCFRAVCKSGDGSHTFHGVTSGEEYFAIMLKTDSPYSINIASDFCTVPRLDSSQPPQKSARAKLPIAGAGHSRRLVRRIHSLDMLNPRDWWEAKDVDGTIDAVVGVRRVESRGLARSKEYYEDDKMSEDIYGT